LLIVQISFTQFYTTLAQVFNFHFFFTQLKISLVDLILAFPHQRLVIAELIVRVLLFPTASAVVVEALKISAEINTLIAIAQTALHILQIRIDLTQTLSS